MKPLAWVTPASVGAAIGAMSDRSVLKAGGVDLMDLLKERLIAPERLVNLRAVPGLDGVDEGERGLRIGPLVTLAQLAEHPVVRKRYRALAEAAEHAATPQIRNVATLGGNLLQRPRCWYFRSDAFHCKKKGGSTCFAQAGENAYHAIFDNGVCAAVHPSATAVALLALGGSVEITAAEGARTLPIADLFVTPAEDVRREHVLGPQEIVTAVTIPKPRAGARSAYLKLGEKASFDWPLAEVAVAFDVEAGRAARPRVVLGAAAPVPMGAKGAEGAVDGQAIDEGVARAAGKAAVAGATPLEHNAYKIPLFETLVRRALLAAWSET